MGSNPLRIKQLLWVFCLLSCLPACIKQQQQPTSLENHSLAETQCLAILPVINKSTEDKGGDIVGELVYTNLLASGRFRAMAASDVTRLVDKETLKNFLAGDFSLAGKLEERLQVQALLVTSLNHYQYRNHQIQGGDDPYVDMDFKLYRLPNAALIWSQHAEGQNQDMGTRSRNPISRVAQLAVEESLAALYHAASATTHGKAAMVADPLKHCGATLENAPH